MARLHLQRLACFWVQLRLAQKVNKVEGLGQLLRERGREALPAETCASYDDQLRNAIEIQNSMFSSYLTSSSMMPQVQALSCAVFILSTNTR